VQTAPEALDEAREGDGGSTARLRAEKARIYSTKAKNARRRTRRSADKPRRTPAACVWMATGRLYELDLETMIARDGFPGSSGRPSTWRAPRQTGSGPRRRDALRRYLAVYEEAATTPRTGGLKAASVNRRAGQGDRQPRRSAFQPSRAALLSQPGQEDGGARHRRPRPRPRADRAARPRIRSMDKNRFIGGQGPPGQRSSSRKSSRYVEYDSPPLEKSSTGLAGDLDWKVLLRNSEGVPSEDEEILGPDPASVLDNPGRSAGALPLSAKADGSDVGLPDLRDRRLA